MKVGKKKFFSMLEFNLLLLLFFLYKLLIKSQLMAEILARSRKAMPDSDKKLLKKRTNLEKRGEMEGD